MLDQKAVNFCDETKVTEISKELGIEERDGKYVIKGKEAEVIYDGIGEELKGGLLKVRSKGETFYANEKGEILGKCEDVAL